jgi:hypothetical protein
MPFVSTRAKLVLSEPDAIRLRYLAQSRTAAAAKVQRAQILLRYSQGETVSAIATVLRTNRPKIERCLSKALQRSNCSFCFHAVSICEKWLGEPRFYSG